MDKCPHRNASLIGDPIPDDIKEHYGKTSTLHEDQIPTKIKKVK